MYRHTFHGKIERPTQILYLEEGERGRQLERDRSYPQRTRGMYTFPRL